MFFSKLFTTAFLNVCIWTSLHAQPTAPPTLFYQFSYVNVKPEEQTNYEALMRNQWKPIFQELVQQGKLVSWILLKRVVASRAIKLSQEYISCFTLRPADNTSKAFGVLNILNTTVSGSDDLAELSKRTNKISQIERTERTVSFRISAGNGTGTSSNWRFLRLSRNLVKNREIDNYKHLINTEIAPMYDAFRADSLLKSYNFTELQGTETIGNVTILASMSFPNFEQAQQFNVRKEMERKVGTRVASRLGKKERRLGSLKEMIIYEKIDNTQKRAL